MCLDHRDCSETQREKVETMTESSNMIEAALKLTGNVKLTAIT